MVGDIRRTTDMGVSDYVVRIAPELDGDEYVATVVEYPKKVLGGGSIRTTSSAPMVTDSDLYVAAGKAIKAFRDDDDEDDEGDGGEE